MDFENLYPRFQDPDQRELLSKQEIAFIQRECVKRVRDARNNMIQQSYRMNRLMRPSQRIRSK